MRKDSDGNIIACPKCGSRNLRKDGWQYWKNNKKRQRWWCQACKGKTIAPIVAEKAPFELEELDEIEHLPIEEIIEHRKKQYSQKLKAKKSKKLINIKINQMGPVGILHFGDPHVDDDGTDLAEIYSLCNLVNNTEGLFGGNLGDIQNNWIGRLQALYGQQSTSAKESWRLTEHFVNQVEWLYLVAGNHDVWSGDGDPLEFIMREHSGVYEQWGARLNLTFPNVLLIRHYKISKIIIIFYLFSF